MLGINHIHLSYILLKVLNKEFNQIISVNVELFPNSITYYPY